MPKPFVLVLALFGIGLAGLPALAAPTATQAEADRLKLLLERYVGGPVAGAPSSVSVTPEGQSYRVAFDLKRMTSPLESFGFGLDAATQTVTLVPNDDGTWHVTADSMPPLVAHVKDQTIAMRSSTYALDGTYDPKIGGFVRQTATQDGMTLDQDAPALLQHRRSGHVMMTQTATATEARRADIAIRYTAADTTAKMTMRAPPSTQGTVAVEPPFPPVDVAYTLPSAAADVRLDGTATWPLLDLWAFLVAHPNRDALTASQDELRKLLRSALPLLAGLHETVSGEGLAVQAQPGEFRVAKLSGSIDLADLSAAGKFASVISVDGLALPALGLPAWTSGFLPTSVEIKPSVTGFHVDAAASEAVAVFDLAHDGFTPEQGQKIARILWPGDGTVTLAKSRIVTPLLDIGLEGEATLGTVPAGRLTVTGAGLDKAIATLQAVTDTDATAGQVLAQFVAAKNLAKPNPDGSYVWVIEASGSGPVSVNGIPLH